MTSRGERGIWQRRYCEHTIGDDRDIPAHMDYTHFNQSSTVSWRTRRIGRIRPFHRCVTSGLYLAGWERRQQ
jgi:putative transposase